jgi:thiol-disulfide isomerase/thioredoxin/YHS domain-containing protein
MFRKSTPHAFLLMLVTAASPVLAGGWADSLDAAKAQAAEAQKPVLIHFYADWCGPCRSMESTVLGNSQVLGALGDKVVGVKINIDDNPELAAQYNIQRLPSDVVIEPNGAVMIESEGPRTLSEYVASIERAATRYNDLLASRQATDNVQDVEITEPNLMLGGYCPYTLQIHRRWEKGSPSFTAQYHGQSYQFVSAEALAEFEASPGRFAPKYLGCDPVVVWETDRAVPGDIRYGAFYDDELYLFTTDANRQRFKADPDQFVRTRVVLHVDQIESVIR